MCTVCTALIASEVLCTRSEDFLSVLVFRIHDASYSAINCILELALLPPQSGHKS